MQVVLKEMDEILVVLEELTELLVVLKELIEMQLVLEELTYIQLVLDELDVVLLMLEGPCEGVLVLLKEMSWVLLGVQPLEGCGYKPTPKNLFDQSHLGSFLAGSSPPVSCGSCTWHPVDSCP